MNRILFFLKFQLVIIVSFISFIPIVPNVIAAGDPVIHVFQPGTPARADEVNENFQDLADRIDGLEQGFTSLGETIEGLPSSTTLPSITVTPKLRKDFNQPNFLIRLVRMEFVKFDTEYVYPEDVYLIEFPCTSQQDIFSHNYCKVNVEEILFEKNFIPNTIIDGYPAEVIPYSKSTHSHGDEYAVLRGLRVTYHYGVEARIKVNERTMINLSLDYSTTVGKGDLSEIRLINEDNNALGNSHDYSDTIYKNDIKLQPNVVPSRSGRQSRINNAINSLGWIKIRKKEVN